MVQPTALLYIIFCCTFCMAAVAEVYANPKRSSGWQIGVPEAVIFAIIYPCMLRVLVWNRP